MNTIILIGRLTSDPELKFFSSGTAISKCTIAIDRSYKKDNQIVTDFIPIEIWGKQAEYAATCLQKGYLIAVSGSLHIDRYIDPTGNNKTFAKVIAKTITKLNVPKSSLGMLSSATNEYQDNLATNSDNDTTNQTNSDTHSNTNNEENAQSTASEGSTTNGQTNTNTNSKTNSSSNSTANCLSNSTTNSQVNSNTQTPADVDSYLANLIEQGDEIPF